MRDLVSIRVSRLNRTLTLRIEQESQALRRRDLPSCVLFAGLPGPPEPAEANELDEDSVRDGFMVINVISFSLIW